MECEHQNNTLHSAEIVATTPSYSGIGPATAHGLHGIPARNSVCSFKPQALAEESWTVALRMSRTYLPSKEPRHTLCITQVLSYEQVSRASC